MAPPNPKRPPRPPPTTEPAAKPKSEVELPFNDSDAQLPPPSASKVRRKLSMSASPEATTDDHAMPSSYESGGEVADPGFTAAFLYVERGPGAGQLVPVRQGVLLIGRASTSSLRLQHPSVSRRHAQLNRKGERFFVRDLASQNGTYVNQLRIDKDVEVFPGDEMVLGTAQLRLRGPNQQSQTGGAKLTRPKTEEATPRQFRVSSSNPVSIAIAGGIVGFGLAAVIGFASFRLFRGPSYEDLEAPDVNPATVAASAVKPAAQAVSKVAEPASPPQSAPAEIVPTITSTTPIPASRPVLAVPKKAAVKPAKFVAHEPAAPVLAREPSKEEPQTPNTPSVDKAVLTRYESGDIEGAIQMAKKKNTKDLLAKLNRFQIAFDAGQNALANRDEPGSFKHLEEALKIDTELTDGWGTLNADLRHKLSSLHTIKGTRLMPTDPTAAKRAFAAALKYDPENSAAQSHLASLRGGADKTLDKTELAKPAKKNDARSAIDAAFAD